MNPGIFPSLEATITRATVFRREVFTGSVGSSLTIDWVRPPGVTHVRVELTGGGGAGNNTTAGGNGGRGAAVVPLPPGIGRLTVVAGAGGVHMSSGGSASSFGPYVTGTGGGYAGGDGTFSSANGARTEYSGSLSGICGPNAGTNTGATGGGNPGAVVLEYVQQVGAMQ